MAKKQTRRSISVRGVTYNQLRDYCAGVSISMSDFIEQRIAEFFAENPVSASASPRPVVVAAPAPARAAAAPAPARKAPAPPVAAPAPVARVEPVIAKPAPRPVPAQSSINRPMPVAARRAVSPPPPPPAPQMVSAPLSSTNLIGAVGRPAPTPAASVLKERLTPAAPRDAKDYRAIRF